MVQMEGRKVDHPDRTAFEVALTGKSDQQKSSIACLYLVLGEADVIEMSWTRYLLLHLKGFLCYSLLSHYQNCLENTGVKGSALENCLWSPRFWWPITKYKRVWSRMISTLKRIIPGINFKKSHSLITVIVSFELKNKNHDSITYGLILWKMY